MHFEYCELAHNCARANSIARAIQALHQLARPDDGRAQLVLVVTVNMEGLVLVDLLMDGPAVGGIVSLQVAWWKCVRR